MAILFVGDIGKKIILDTEIDLSAATTRRIYYRKPDGQRSFWTAANEGTNTISYTTTAATDLDVAGGWQFQAYVVTPSWTLYGTVAKEEVQEPLVQV